MRCLKCGSDNREGRKFCTNCGAPLIATCLKCSAPVQPDEKFCGECGAALSDTPAPKAEAARTVRLGERRHLTVLFSDLVGSTGIAAELDPEEWRETVGNYHRAAAEAITRYGGHVAKYLGDGVMAFFGYPEAHDDDAERATRAGLAIVEAIAKLEEQANCAKLAVRIGIDSGPVVVGAGAGKEADVFGDAPNIAARVQAVAEPGNVLITSATHRLVSGLFVVEERLMQKLKGVTEPLDLFRVIRPSGMRGRFAAAAAVRGMTPFINREEELSVLMNRWKRVREGEGQVVTIVGEAGIGKSRLMQHLRQQIAGDPHTWLECTTAAFSQNTPFYAVTDMLQQTFHWHTNQDSERRLAALEASLTLAGLKLEEAVPLVASLLELRVNGKYPPLAMPSDQQRKRLLATLAAWTIGFAKAQPLVMATEDLHWADPSTLELIQLLIEQGATAPLMLLYTARPEFRAQWPLRAHHTHITLNRLSARNVRTMLGQVAAQKALSEAAISAVIERTSGVPLFVEEITRAVLESSGASFGAHEIPVTLHDSLMARLDRLGQAKEILQIGAVIGSEFSYQLLHAVHPISEEALRHALLTLSDSDLLYVHGIAPDATYLFKHALIRDAAYEALLKSRRKELHGRVATAIDEKFAALKDAHPEVLARHWTEAGEVEPAIAEWLRAGNMAEARSAFKEAEENYQQGLKLITLLPESPERDLRELELRQALVRMMFMTRSHTDRRAVQAAEDAVMLAEKTGNLRQLLNMIIARGVSALVSGEVESGIALADRALKLAARDDSPSIRGRVQVLQTMAHYCSGDLAGAERCFTEGVEFFVHPSVKRIPGVTTAAFNYGACTAWRSGRADIAHERISRMLAEADRSNPFELAFSGKFAADLLGSMREYEQSELFAERALELAEKHNFVEIIADCHYSIGRARAQLGRPSEGIALIRQAMASLLEIGGARGTAARMGPLAEAQGRGGLLIEALQTIDQALEASRGLPYLRPEILRISGELRLESGQTEFAEPNFRNALELARGMGAKTLELRTTTSLARLLALQGRREQGRAMLAEIYNWFTEGFDTADLKEAKELLDELSN